MANYFDDNDDLQYYFEKGIEWGPLVRATERDLGKDGAGVDAAVAETVDGYRQMAQMVGTFVADEVAPAGIEIDRQEFHLEKGEAVMPKRMAALFEQIKALDLHWLCVPKELGGMNSPLLLYFVNTELFARADVSITAHHSFHGGIALALLIFSIREGSTSFDGSTITDTRFKDAIEEVARGDAWGTMCITEPDAGSDMAAMRTVGEQDEHGNWFVTGQKIFITSGHGKYHFVIARTEKAAAGSEDGPLAGLGGLSFFLVPAWDEDEHGRRHRYVTIDRIEEKLGHHGSCTTALGFDRAPAILLGQRGEGFKYMLTLMNNARLGVGFESIGLCEAAYRMARDYAAQRPSMGKTIDRHEMVADLLDEMRTDIQGIRALAMYGAYHEELATKYELFATRIAGQNELETKQLERRAKRHKANARRVTPLLKYIAAEKAVEMSRRNMQIHGGNGYMQEYGAEKLLRDALVMPVYEGTSQIQSLMAMKDALGAIMKAPQEFVKRLAQARWRSLSARDPLERRVAKLQHTVLDAQQFLVRKTATDKVRSLSDKPLSQWRHAFLEDWNPKRDFAYAMLHAERLTRMMTDAAICEVLLDQARKHPERADVLKRYLVRAEPRCRHLLDEIQTTGAELLARLQHDDRSNAAAAE
ncbi:MAG: acyl-CoA dehydrogenase family protein [Deltaproteobacteria bacterium]|nr:acyl-CoA dehydrogenase family protein [Deltaproteobacteria bacterium]MBP7287154.1 acyl-CoA dehydrogenase family protein [Nannocystaceae bacterium]